MLEIITFVLVVALAMAWAKLARHRRALRSLGEALKRRQPFLRDAYPDAAGKSWDEFCITANAMIVEVGKLEAAQTSQLAQLEATLGSLKEAVLIVDSHNHILLANNSLQAIFPKATEIIDQRLEVVLHSVAFLNYVEIVRQGEAEPHHEIEFVETEDTRWVEVTGTTIPALDRGGGEWVLFVLHDVTRQKGLERVRKEFVANVSHELRTPLAVIKGYIETLVDGHHEMNLADRHRFLETIQRHTERLNSLLEDLLTLSRLESINPALQRESTAMHPLIEAIVEDYRSRPGTVNHDLRCEVDPAIDHLLIDPLKITQVFGNLLDNAIKYTPEGAVVVVAGHLHHHEVEWRVSDDGPGIPSSDLPHIFERFYRVDKGRSRDKGGTGLGLSIVKHIVQLHGGKVSVESEPGQGTAFNFTLPTTGASRPDGGS